MISNLFWVILRSVAVPIIAIYLLSQTALGEKGALLAVGLALLVTNVIAIAWNSVKILGNTLLLRPRAILKLVFVILIQIVSVLFIWGYYFNEYTDLLKF